MTTRAPPKVTARSEGVWIAPALACSATRTGPSVIGPEPNRLENLRRMRDPATLVRTIWRTVDPAIDGPGESGAAPHAATHTASGRPWSVDVAAELPATTAATAETAMTRATREQGRGKP